MLNALWGVIAQYKDDFSRVLIFLPSRRAIRSAERMIVEKMGCAVILPCLVPLGDGVEEVDEEYYTQSVEKSNGKDFINGCQC